LIPFGGEIMELYYNDTQITSHVEIQEALAKDEAGGRMDSLRLQLGNSEEMMHWAPQENDRVRVVHEGYPSGTMYVDLREMIENGYVLYARSAPYASQPEWACYENIRLSKLALMAAQEQGLELELYGTDAAQHYPWLVRRRENWATFLQRLAERESMLLKYTNGKLLLIDWAWACAQRANLQVEITPETKGAVYTCKGKELKSLIVKGLHGTGRAQDADARGSAERTVGNEPVHDPGQAARWARGLLLQHNLQAEEIRLEWTLAPEVAAVSVMEISGLRALAGNWLVMSVEHDLLRLQSTIHLRRCKTGIL
jgi:hypothetical protein